jgi:hypothetical protein
VAEQARGWCGCASRSGTPAARAVAVREPVHADGGEREGLLVSVPGRALANRGARRAARPRARGGGPSATPRAPAAQLGAPGPRTCDRVGRARTAGGAGRSSGGGGDRARGGLAARRSPQSASTRSSAWSGLPASVRRSGTRSRFGVAGVGERLRRPRARAAGPHPSRPGRGPRFTPRVRVARAGRSIRRTAPSTAWVLVGACGRRVLGSRFASR